MSSETITETAWERRMLLSGIEQYERAHFGRAAYETGTGIKSMRRLIETATLAIIEMQKKVLMTDSRIDRNARATAVILPAQNCALIALRVIIDRTYAAVDPEKGYNYQIMVREASRGIETELNYLNWLATSKDEAKAYAEEQGLAKAPQSMAERLIKESGVCRRTLVRWRKSFAALNAYSWDTLEQHYCGDAIITAVVEALPEDFEIVMAKDGAKTIKHVRMTDSFRKGFDQMEAKVAQMQVVKKPMITKPRRWVASEA